jgi:antitoxin component YwqK of YwqJK toxin-antitoxin module
LKTYLSSLFILFIFFACNKKENLETQKPLVLRGGILYQDSTSSKPFTGRNKSRMLDMMIEYDVVDGIKEGDFIVYYSNKKNQMMGKMKQNKNVGLWKYYFKNGALQTTGYFNDDKPDSIWSWYSDKGILIEMGSFIEGKRNGGWKNFDSSGNLTYSRTFKDDKLVDSTRIQ